MSSASVSI